MPLLDQVDFAYPGGAFRLRVRELAVGRGERVALTGPSGSGKTTLLALAEAPGRAFRIARMGLVFQELELVEHLDVLDNVLLPFRLTGSLALDRAARERAAALLDEVGLGALQKRQPRRLSQGERQRAAVCRALVTEPPLLPADEPTASLDDENRERVLALLLAQARRSGATLVAVTHDADSLARFDRVLDARGWA